MVKKKKNSKVHKPKARKPKREKESTIKITKERDIAMDFATKVYQRFDKMIKSVVLFGSSAKQLSKPTSDIDIIILIDDVSVKWDEELIAWYRDELRKLVEANKYRKTLHINTVKLSTWWSDLLRGDPVIMNIIRYGEPLLDFGGFFTPLRILLQEGKIRATPEAIYNLLQRTPKHMIRAHAALLSAVDALYWAMVDSAHAALIASGVTPPSPEEIPEIMKQKFVDTNKIKMKYLQYYIDSHYLEKQIVHGEKTEIKGKEIDELKEKTNEFIRVMAEIVDKLMEEKETTT